MKRSFCRIAFGLPYITIPELDLAIKMNNKMEADRGRNLFSSPSCVGATTVSGGYLAARAAFMQSRGGIDLERASEQANGQAGGQASERASEQERKLFVLLTISHRKSLARLKWGSLASPPVRLAGWLFHSLARFAGLDAS